MTDMTTLYSGTMQVPERHQFDVGVLQTYLASRIPDFAGPLTVELFKGGQSNPTYKLHHPEAHLRDAREAGTGREAAALGARDRARVPRDERARRHRRPGAAACTACATTNR